MNDSMLQKGDGEMGKVLPGLDVGGPENTVHLQVLPCFYTFSP